MEDSHNWCQCYSSSCGIVESLGVEKVGGEAVEDGVVW